MRFFGGIAVTAALLSPNAGSAGPVSYDCLVAHQYRQSANGDLRSPQEPRELGKRLTVDRATGRVEGALYDNKHFQEIRVVDRGSPEQSFKAIWISPMKDIAGSEAGFLTIREFDTGLNKAFILLDDSDVYTGFCR